MIEKLKELKDKFNRLTEEIADPAVIADMQRWQKLVKEHSDLAPIIENGKIHQIKFILQKIIF